MQEIFAGLIGNEQIKEHIGRDIKSGDWSHAYIIEGAAGSGKRTAAGLIAAALSCERRASKDAPLPCGECNNCKRISKGISGDVVWITNGDAASIGVGAIRDLKSGLHTLPNDSDVRTYIIYPAERMTEQAQNALLLSLEEPPSFVVFLLLTEDATKLLDTVRSRAKLVRTETFSSDEVEKYLAGTVEGARIKKSNPEKFKVAVKLAGGSLGRAVDFLGERAESLELISCRAVASEMISHIVKGRISELLKIAYGKSIKNSAEAKHVLTFADCAIRDMLAVKRNEEAELTFYTSAEAALEDSGTVAIKKLFYLHEEICRAITKLETNVSVKIALTDFAFKVASYKR